jgi:hypothetical protein
VVNIVAYRFYSDKKRNFIDKLKTAKFLPTKSTRMARNTFTKDAYCFFLIKEPLSKLVKDILEL